MTPDSFFKTMNDKRYIRWQRYTISQFTFALNLFLGLAVGALAFAAVLIKDESFVVDSCQKLFFFVGLVGLCMSVIAGCAAVVSRLMDFRLTAQKIRKGLKGVKDNELGVYSYKTKLLGRLSWRLFWFELVTFGIGLIGLAGAVLGKYGHKII